MQSSRLAGLAVVFGTLCAVITMALHPTGAELLRAYDATAPRNALAHGLALVAVPLLLFGMREFSHGLASGGEDATARLAWMIYACASGCVVIAGAASGLIAPAMARRVLAAPEVESWTALFTYTGVVNQAFATLYVIGLGLAMLLWSLSAWHRAALPRWLAGLGTVVGVAFVALMLGGRPHLDVHTFGAIVLTQAVWFLGVGLRLLQGGPRSRTGS